MVFSSEQAKHKDLEILVWLFKECPTLNLKFASGIQRNKTMQNALLEAAKARFD